MAKSQPTPPLAAKSDGKPKVGSATDAFLPPARTRRWNREPKARMLA